MTTRLSIDISWDTPSIFYSDSNPNRSPAKHPSFLPQSSPHKVASRQASPVKPVEYKTPSEQQDGVEDNKEIEVTVMPKMSSEDHTSWDGVEDITDTQWAAEVEATGSSSKSPVSYNNLDIHQSSATSSNQYGSPPRPQAIDLSDSPSQPVTPTTPRRSLSSRDSSPVDWPLSPECSNQQASGSKSRSTETEEGSITIAGNEDESMSDKYENEEHHTARLRSAEKGRNELEQPIGPSLDDLFADDDDDANSHVPKYDIEGDEYDQEFGDNFDIVDPDLYFQRAASTSNTPRRPSTLAPLSAFKPYPMSDPTPHPAQVSPTLIHPIKLIQDLPPNIQEFYLNHWKRGADKPSAPKPKSGKRVLEVESESEDDVMPTTMTKRRGRGRGGARGFWGRGRAFRGRGGAARGKKR